MAGRLKEQDFASLKEAYDPDQSSLSQFCGAGDTTIAVVRKPSDTGIDAVCDEWCPELGMPEQALSDYWELRSAYEDNQYVSNHDAANRAFNEAELTERFEEYVRTTDEAQEALDKLVERLDAGENITLVCFESDGKKCHRHILMQMIEKRREASLTAGRALSTSSD